jgi:hypothetical protein
MESSATETRFWNKSVNVLHNESNKNRWWNRRASIVSLILATTLIPSIAAVKVLEDTARAEIDDYDAKREVAVKQSEILRHDNLLEQEMQRIAQDLTENNRLELFCADNQAETDHVKSIHKNHPITNNSLIVIDYNLCASAVDARSIDHVGPYSFDEFMAKFEASYAAFHLGHEIGHELLGKDEQRANCVGNYYYPFITEQLGIEAMEERPAPANLEDC